MVPGWATQMYYGCWTCWNRLPINHSGVLAFPGFKNNIINSKPYLAVLMWTAFCLKHYGELMYFVPSKGGNKLDLLSLEVRTLNIG